MSHSKEMERGSLDSPEKIPRIESLQGKRTLDVVGCAKRTRPEEMEPHLTMQSDPYVNWEKKGAH